MKFAIKAFGACAAMFVAAAAPAATIAWSAPVDASGNASDVITAGNLFAASTTGPTTTLNGVTFVSGFAGAITLAGVDTITSIFSVPNFAGPDYNALVGTGAYSLSTRPFSISINGLTSGNSYAVQLFAPFWDANWATAFTGGASTSGLVNLTGINMGVGASTVPQFVTGTFVATGSSQLITLSSPTLYVLVAAAQVRELSGAVPEPASWAMLIAGFGLTGATMHRRRSAALIA